MRLLALLLTVLFVSRATASDAWRFDDAVAQFKAAYPCAGASISPPYSESSGRLFGCVDGPAQTAKYFIDEEGRSGRVKRIKLIWNDWFKDLGYGLHADRSKALKMLSILLDMYAPNSKTEAISAFNTNENWSILSNGKLITYKYSRGPAIEERVLQVELSP